MNSGELAAAYAELGVQPGVALPELERAYMKRNFALITRRDQATGERDPAIEAQRQQLRATYDRLVEHLRREAASAAAAGGGSGAAASPAAAGASTSPRPPVVAASAALQARAAGVLPVADADEAVDPYTGKREFALIAFDRPWVNLLVPPLLLGMVWFINLTPFVLFLKGFHVWMHEFGHATLAWLCGFHALPVPLGWTPVQPVYSHFVYWGLLSLFGLLAWAGWRERKAWPVIAAVALAGLQYYMTWRMPGHRQEFWYGAFGGVGGEFVLSTLLMMAFFVQLPEKFKWGACRYVFFLLGATCLLNIWLFWLKVYDGIEEIPFGSMINGEDDAGGDMNALVDDYGWTKFQIRRTYYVLGQGCWLALGLTWAVFALRLNRVGDWIASRLAGGGRET